MSDKKMRSYKLTNEDIQQILVLFSQDVKIRTIAKRFNVHRATIWNIRKKYGQAVSPVYADRDAVDRAREAGQTTQ